MTSRAKIVLLSKENKNSDNKFVLVSRADKTAKPDYKLVPVLDKGKYNGLLQIKKIQKDDFNGLLQVQESKSICPICVNNVPNCVLLPCRHNCCKTCALKLTDCHMCRAKISEKIDFYHA
jgi:hypothetical protein